MMFSSNKKGMSPLIATVLLIAFAVALGAMIMNWSAGIEEGAHGEENGDTSYCEGVTLASDGSICYGDNTIQFDVKNVGSERIGAVKLHIASDATEYNIEVKDSALISGESTSKSVPYAHTGGDVDVNFIPLVSHDGELAGCPSSGFVKTLSEC
ncbi:MAG: archaellin/type IV pilin N-terminal domain-containing protein [Nanoarchaeota archaeon]